MLVVILCRRRCAETPTSRIRSRDTAAGDRCYSNIVSGSGGRCGTNHGRQVSP